MRNATVCGCLVLLFGGAAAAQSPTLTLTPEIVAPGASVAASVTGTPGQHFALVGSLTGAGTYGGVDLAVGSDFVVFATGTLDGNGQMVAFVIPPFVGTTHDRLYFQAATADTADFAAFQLSPGRIVR